VRFVAFGLFLALAACSSPGNLAYAPPQTVTQGQPTVSSVEVTDKRDEKPNRIATIRGGYGNPLKVLDTTTPVANEVQKVFTDALRARGMLTADRAGPYRFQVVLHTLYGDQYIGRKAEAKFDLTVVDATGRPIYRDTIARNDYEFTFFDNGIFSSIDTLGKHVEGLLDKSVDEALDKAALRDALRAQNRPAA
jgi:uncharacterized lipoprotein YajG